MVKLVTPSEFEKRSGMSIYMQNKTAEADPYFPLIIDGRNKKKIDIEKYNEEYLPNLQRKTFELFRAKIAGKGGVHETPLSIQIAEAAAVLRFIALEGHEPPFAPFWRNAARLSADVPRDVAIALAIAVGAPMPVAVERCERLLALPSKQRANEIVAVHARLDKFYGGQDDTEDATASDLPSEDDAEDATAFGLPAEPAKISRKASR